MRRQSLIVRSAAKIVLICFFQMILLSSAGLTQPIECPFDKANPTLGSARISFQSLNYICAEEEIQAFMQLDNISIEQKADAHVLLAAVYYAKLKNDKEKKNRVIEQFKQAFKSYRAWRGDLDISSTEFFDMMQEAQALVDEEAKSGKPAPAETPVEQEITAPPPEIEEEPVEEEEKAAVATIEPAETDDKPAEDEDQPAITTMPGQESTAKASKPWYKKWWAIGLGVGLVVGVVVLAGGGGSDDGGTTDTTLPDFPDPPVAGKKKH
ncbi:MAG: hypothetical protein KAR42_06470 [candidate division Zixibacteria bacterium]|nr:hypothetical protein [candidate division Zixibacteria bacterium]